MIQLPKDEAAINVFWDDELETYVLTLLKQREFSPVRLDIVQLSMLRDLINEVMGEAQE